jgi:hypothetical protein
VNVRQMRGVLSGLPDDAEVIVEDRFMRPADHWTPIEGVDINCADDGHADRVTIVIG